MSDLRVKPSRVKADFPLAKPGRTITVEVSSRKGKLVIDDSKQVVRMELNDRIRWVSKANIGFWVVFEHQTPFEVHAIDAPDATQPRRPLLHGAFKYHIVLESNHLVRLDPVVVVDPPPGDPNVKSGDDYE